MSGDEHEPEVPAALEPEVDAHAVQPAAVAGAVLVQVTVPMPGPLRTKGSLSQNWREWQQVWNSYEIVARLNSQTDDYRLATFITCIGHAGLRIYNSLPFANNAEKRDMAKVLELMEAHCIGETNVTYERFLMDRRQQQPGETFDTFLTAVKEMAHRCQFGDKTDEMLRDKIVFGVLDDSLRKQLLQKKGLTLASCVDMCRAHEATAKQMKDMGANGDDDVHVVRCYKKTVKSKPGKTAGQPRTPDKSRYECSYCGLKHARGRNNCPANGKKCSKCSKMNHFARKCRSGTADKKTVHCTQQSSDEDDLLSLTLTQEEGVNSVQGYQKQIFALMEVGGRNVKFQLDTGATCNVIRKEDVPPGTKIEPTEQQLSMFNKTKLKAEGKCNISLRNLKNHKKYRGSFVVVEGVTSSIIGARSVQQMGLIEIKYDKIRAMEDQRRDQQQRDIDHPGLTLADLTARFKNVFEGEVGRLGEKLRFEVDETVQPVQLPVRRVAVAMKPKLKSELERLENLKIIEKQEAPTKWVSHMVVVRKPNNHIRICLDPKPLNKALQRSHYQMPTLEEVLPQLNKAKVFTVADAKNGFWHVELDQAASEMTTFGTPFGRYRWKRMPFGINIAPEVFQKRIRDAVEDLPGIWALADDILITGDGDTKEEAIKDHDQKLIRFLQRCESRGIKLNKEKFRLKLDNVKYMGHILTNEGVKPDPAKIRAIVDMDKPKDVAGVRRIMGMVNYLARYLKNLTDVTEPLRQLTHKDAEFVWTTVQDEAYQKMKDTVTKAPLLRYFDPKEQVTLQCDASSQGLGATLLQSGQPVAYASRALRDPETRYAQIEKELLAIIYGLEKFDQYVYGLPVIVESDHKPLEMIQQKPLAAAPKRLQAMLLRLQRYDVTVKYKQGSEMYIADLLSRAYLKDETGGSEGEILTIEEDNEISQATGGSLAVSEERLNQIKEATARDETSTELKKVILEEWPETKHKISSLIKPYYGVRDELAVQNGLIFRGERVVVPQSMRALMLQRIHSSHMGVNSCIRRAKDNLYWPGMSSQVKDRVERCETCRKFETTQQKESLKPHFIPERPWVKLGADLCSFADHEYLVIADYLSSFIEVDRLEKTTSGAVIRALKKQFSRHGIPNELITDNGPQFVSKAFEEFAQNWEFKHTTSSPGYPKSNGKAESAVKVVKTLMKKAADAKTDFWLALLEYRNTPTEGVRLSPAQRLYNRRTRTLLPAKDTTLHPKMAEGAAKALVARQEKQVERYNRRAKDLPSLELGEVVRVQPLTGKSKPSQWKKAVITKTLPNRSYELNTESGKSFRRNRVHLKKTKESPPKQCDSTSQGDEEPTQIRLTVKPKDQTVRPTEKKMTVKQVPKEEGLRPARVTRSGREVKVPKYLKDYVCYK